MHEIKKCGDVLYKYNNHWTFVKTQDIIDEEKNSGNEVTEDEVNANLAKALSLTRKYVADMGGAWMVDAPVLGRFQITCLAPRPISCKRLIGGGDSP